MHAALRLTCFVAANPAIKYPVRFGADAWLNRWEAQEFEVHEQTMRLGDGEILSLILISDQHMLEDSSDHR